MNEAEWEALLASERKQGQRLLDDGILKRSWTVPGRREAVALFETRDGTELHAALTSLPIFPYADIRVEALAGHPMDVAD
jgi:muconolactone D-isomerase